MLYDPTVHDPNLLVADITDTTLVVGTPYTAYAICRVRRYKRADGEPLRVPIPGDILARVGAWDRKMVCTHFEWSGETDPYDNPEYIMQLKPLGKFLASGHYRLSKISSSGEFRGNQHKYNPRDWHGYALVEPIGYIKPPVQQQMQSPLSIVSKPVVSKPPEAILAEFKL